MDLDLHKNHESPFPRAIETCLKGMVPYVRDMFFQVRNRYACLITLDTTYYYSLETCIAFMSNSEFKYYVIKLYRGK